MALDRGSTRKKRGARAGRETPAAEAPAIEAPPAAAPPAAETPPPAPPARKAPDARSVQTKLDRLTRESRAQTLSPETAGAVKKLFSEVHAAYFRDDFARADALLDQIARQLEK